MGTLVTLGEAEQQIEEWQTAIGCLIGAAEGPGLRDARTLWMANYSLW
jgi:hypothetical protein